MTESKRYHRLARTINSVEASAGSQDPKNVGVVERRSTPPCGNRLRSKDIRANSCKQKSCPPPLNWGVKTRSDCLTWTSWLFHRVFHRVFHNPRKPISGAPLSTTDLRGPGPWRPVTCGLSGAGEGAIRSDFHAGSSHPKEDSQGTAPARRIWASSELRSTTVLAGPPRVVPPSSTRSGGAASERSASSGSTHGGSP